MLHYKEVNRAPVAGLGTSLEESTALKSVANAPGGVSGRGKAAGRLRWE